MKIGVFDSGLGGLIVTRAFLNKLGNYDYIYFGDTKNLPYGEKSPEEVLEYTINAMEFLIKNNAKIIIIACNTASSIALRYLQQKWIPAHYPYIKVLGVVVPTVEEAIASSKTAIGVVATNSTIDSHIYEIEIKKINPSISVQELATPKIVPFVESNDFASADLAVKEYVSNFHGIDSLILGCTHYPLLKESFQKHCGEGIHIISQDDIMGEKLADYLSRHPEIETLLDKNSKREFYVSQLNEHYKSVADTIFPGITITLKI